MPPTLVVQISNATDHSRVQIKDISAPITLDPQETIIATDTNTYDELVASLTIRQLVKDNKIEFLLNGVDLDLLDIVGSTTATSAVYDDTLSAQYGATTLQGVLDAIKGQLHTGALMSDSVLYLGDQAVVDAAATLDVGAPAIANFKINARQTTNKHGIKVYDDGDGVTRGELWLGTDNQGDPVAGWGYIHAESNGVTFPLLVQCDPIKLVGAVEQTQALYTQPHVLEAETSPYTVLSTDHNILIRQTAPGAIQILLPAVVVGRSLIIKDALGDAAGNNITVTPNGAEKIDGAGSYVISANYGSVELLGTNYAGATREWFILNKKT